MRTDVSVILPVFNGEDYLRDAIESILSQTLRDFELIIINDGSTDDSSKIIASFTDKRIVRIDHRKNLGLIASLNEGISASKGKYTARMDADDIALPERLGKQFIALEKDASLIVTGSSVIAFGKKTVTRRSVPDDASLKAGFPFRNPFNHPTVMFRRETLISNNIQYSEEFLHAEDYALWWRLFPFGKFSNSAEPLLKYRIHEEQVTVRHNEIAANSVKKILGAVLEQLDMHSPDATTTLFQLHAMNPGPSLSWMQKAERLLLDMTAANDKLKFFPVNKFGQTCGKIWFSVCTTLASNGYRTERIYLSSELSETYSPPNMLAIKFKLKSSAASKKLT